MCLCLFFLLFTALAESVNPEPYSSKFSDMSIEEQAQLGSGHLTLGRLQSSLVDRTQYSFSQVPP